MYQRKKLIGMIISLVLLFSFTVCTVYGVTEEEVQQQVTEQGKEAAAGNVLIWFLCAVAFLKVSQKADSFMSSLGVNVGKTGGSLLAEVMIATRGISKAMNQFGGHSGGIGSQKSGGSDWALSGGLSGVVGRHFSQSAAENVTGQKDTVMSSVARAVYDNSIAEGGAFANSVVSSIAHGGIGQNGSMKGQEAATAFRSYMGLNHVENEKFDRIDSNNNNPISSSKYTDTGQETVPDGEIPFDTSSMEYDGNNSNGTDLSQLENRMDEYSPIETKGDSIVSDTSGDNVDRIDDRDPISVPFVSDISQENGVLSSAQIIQDSMQETSSDSTGQASSADWLQDSPVVAETMGTYSNRSSVSSDTNTTQIVSSEESIFVDATGENSIHNTTTEPLADTLETSAGNFGVSETGYQESVTVLESQDSSSGMMQAETMQTMPLQTEPFESNHSIAPQYTDMEIGGGRITGVETSPKHPNGIKFAMYSADKYTTPDTDFNVVKAVDGSKWYHQYAKNTVEKTPFMKPDGKIGYDESLVKKLPPAPKRKDRI